MKNEICNFQTHTVNYLNRLNSCFNKEIISQIEKLSDDLLNTWIKNNQVFLAGNGGSAANAMHIANDLHYGVGACGLGEKIPGIKVEALPANPGIITCLGNDTGYENIFSHQLKVKANENDLLVALSGSGNSPNIIKALEIGKQLKMKTYAILAYDGGKSLDLADEVIHFPINDMQIAEDTQLIIGHTCMQWLNTHKPQRG